MAFRLVATTLTASILTTTLMGCVRDPYGTLGHAAAIPGLRGRLVQGRLVGVPHAPLVDRLEVFDLRMLQSVQGEWFTLGSPSREMELLLARIDGLKGDLGAASERMESLVRQGGAPEASVDLAAVYFERARREPEGAAVFLPMALEVLESARPEAREGVEYRFNRALILASLGLKDAARRDWEWYLQLDAGSPWAREAEWEHDRLATIQDEAGWNQMRLRLDEWLRSRQGTEDLDTLVAKAVDRYPLFTARYAETEVIPRWAEVAGVDPARADDARELLTAIGRALFWRSGDRMLLATANHLDSLRAGSSMENLRRGFLAYQEAYQALDVHGVAAATPLLERARRLLVRAESPAAAWTDLQLAIGDWYEGRYALSLERVRDLRERAEQAGYLSLVARCWQIEGINQFQLRKLTETLAAYGAARDLSFHLGEMEQVVHLDSNRALTFAYLGEMESAWDDLLRALRTRDRIVQPRRLYTLMRNGGEIAFLAGYHHVALAFFDAAVPAAEQWESPAAIAESLWWHARCLNALGDAKAALADLEMAHHAAEAIDAPMLKTRILSDLRMIQAEELMRRDPRAAVGAFDTALAGYRTSEFADYQPGVLHRRARARLALGDVDGAERDLTAAIAFYEEGRGLLLEPEQRISLFDLSGEIFEDMVRLQLDEREDVRRALAYAERGRARTLLESTLQNADGPHRPPTLPLREVQAALPPDVTVLVFSVMADRVASWRLGRDDIRFLPIDLSAQELAAGVEDALAELKVPGSAPFPASQRLFDQLLRPHLESLPPDGRLVVVPHRELYKVPFAALIDRHTGRFVIEDRAISIAPSAGFFIVSLHAEQRSMDVSGPSLAAFGDPALRHGAYGWLRPLPGAADEVRAIAPLYPAATIRLGAEFTESELRRLAPEATVVHLATHVVVNPDTPGRSRLLVSPAADGGGDLLLDDVRSMLLRRTRLLVLSACSTARGRIWRTEGVSALAQGFLASGVPAVVASLWDVEDRATEGFFVDFHHALVRGASPADALREAQLQRIRQNRSPSDWAAFELFGSGISPLNAGSTGESSYTTTRRKGG